MDDPLNLRFVLLFIMEKREALRLFQSVVVGPDRTGLVALRTYSCSAVGCSFIGFMAFYRLDARVSRIRSAVIDRTGPKLCAWRLVGSANVQILNNEKKPDRFDAAIRPFHFYPNR